MKSNDTYPQNAPIAVMNWLPMACRFVKPERTKIEKLFERGKSQAPTRSGCGI